MAATSLASSPPRKHPAIHLPHSLRVIFKWILDSLPGPPFLKSIYLYTFLLWIFHHLNHVDFTYLCSSFLFSCTNLALDWETLGWMNAWIQAASKSYMFPMLLVEYFSLITQKPSIEICVWIYLWDVKTWAAHLLRVALTGSVGSIVRISRWVQRWQVPGRNRMTGQARFIMASLEMRVKNPKEKEMNT